MNDYHPWFLPAIQPIGADMRGVWVRALGDGGPKCRRVDRRDAVTYGRQARTSCEEGLKERMADRNEAFIREVDEELRREQLQKLWERYGIYVVGLALLLLAGVGGYKLLESRRLSESEAAGARFEQALRMVADGKEQDAAAIFADLASNGPAGYQLLAQLQIANAHAKAGRTDAAVAAFDAIAKAAQSDQVIAELAALKAAMLRLDAADWTEMENRLTPLIGERSVWRSMARETWALAAYKAGKAEDARKVFEQILADRATPQSVSERALVMLSLLTDAEAAKAASVVTTVPSESPATKEPEKGAKGDTATQKKK